MLHPVSRPLLSPAARDMLTATLFFAVMNVGVKILSEIPAHEIVFFRALVSLVAAYVLLRREGISPWGKRRVLLLARGLAGTVALIAYFYSLHLMPLATAVTIQHMSPLFTILIAGPLLGERATRTQWGFFLLAFVGVLMIKGMDARVTLGELSLGLVAAAFAGLAYNLVRMLRDSDHALVVVLYFPLVTVPLVGGYTLSHWVWPGLLELALLLAVGLATTAAQVYMTRAFQRERASRVSIIYYLGIVVAMILGWILFGEGITPLALAGAGLIILSVVGIGK